MGDFNDGITAISYARFCCFRLACVCRGGVGSITTGGAGGFGETDSMASPPPAKPTAKTNAKIPADEKNTADDVRLGEYEMPPAVSPEQSAANMKKWEKEGKVKWDGTRVRGMPIRDVASELQRMTREELGDDNDRDSGGDHGNDSEDLRDDDDRDSD